MQLRNTIIFVDISFRFTLIAAICSKTDVFRRSGQHAQPKRHLNPANAPPAPGIAALPAKNLGHLLTIFLTWDEPWDILAADVGTPVAKISQACFRFA